MNTPVQSPQTIRYLEKPVSLPEWLAMRKVILLDFDGVFVDSNQLKVDCMAQALGSFGPEKVRPFLTYFRANFGRPRRRHFEIFHRDYLDDGLPFEPFYAQFAGHYGDLVSEGYATLSLTPGCRQFLEAADHANIPCYIATGGDPSQVRAVLEGKEIDHLIAGVSGAPEEKIHILPRILTAKCCKPGESIFFGDALADCKAAATTGVPFVFVSKYALIAEADLPRDGQPYRSVRNLNLADY